MTRSIEPRRKGSAPMSQQTVRTQTCAPSIAFRRVAWAAFASMSDATTVPLPCRWITSAATRQVSDLIQIRHLPPDGACGGDLEEGIVGRRKPPEVAGHGGRLVVGCVHNKLSGPNLLRHPIETKQDLSRHNR